jgi:NADH-quinone oxidoreductase subunit A
VLFPLCWFLIPEEKVQSNGGLEPVGDARMKFDILYYVIGILYLIFDLEIIFLFPLATVLFSLGSLLAFWVVMIFLIILTIGFLYEWFHGALEIVAFYWFPTLGWMADNMLYPNS